MDLGDGHSGENANEELAPEGFHDCRATKTRFKVLRLATEENGVGGLDRADILALEDCDWDWVGQFREPFLQSSYGLRGTDAGDEMSWLLESFLMPIGYTFPARRF